ncbi:MAG TPA: hypothetical protein PLN69_04465 [bacterium]|nr:hypothetical protein [bacterium]
MHRITGILITATLVFFAFAACAQDTPSAEDLVGSMLTRYDTIKNYKVAVDQQNLNEKTKEPEQRTCNFWANMEPYALRLEVVDGSDKGSVVVFNKKRNAKAVRAKQSFMPVAISVSKDDPRLKGFTESNWETDAKNVIKNTGEAKPVLKGGSKSKDRAAWKITYENVKGDYDNIQIWVDKEEKVMLQFEYYKNGKLIERKTWYDFEINTKLDQKLFKL